MMFLAQLRNELYKMFARKRTYIGFGAFIAAHVLILGLLHLPQAKRGIMRQIRLASIFITDPESYFGGLTLGVLVMGISFGLLAALYISLVAGDIVAKESEDGTLRMILCRPITRLRLLTVKWLACLIYTFVLVMFLAASALLISTAFRGGLGRLFMIVPQEGLRVTYETGEGLARFGVAILCLSYSALVIGSVGFMFSCFRMKPAAATILTLSVFFVDFVLVRMRDLMPYLEPYRQWFITTHTSSWMRAFDYDPPWESIAWSWTYLLAVHVVCFTIGVAGFYRRDLKG